MLNNLNNTQYRSLFLRKMEWTTQTPTQPRGVFCPIVGGFVKLKMKVPRKPPFPQRIAAGNNTTQRAAVDAIRNRCNRRRFQQFCMWNLHNQS